jgi:bifunctional DNA primase/polymerase-like protein/uncharacterized protein DUF5906
MKNQLLIAAYKYITNGICVIPTNDNKIPCISSWKKYQEEIITIEEAETGFDLPYAKSLSVVCGRSSGNLEVIDIDTKYDLTGKLFEKYMQDIADNDQPLHDSLLVITTRSGGYHLYYRCEKVEGNQKLAQRHASDDELKANPGDKIRVLIETRGQGGYVVAPPSAGYKIFTGQEIPTITLDQREILLELARSYNEVVEQPKKEYTLNTNSKEFFTTPWDDYNSRGDIIGLLNRHGWSAVKQTSTRTYFRRPGKDKGTSGDYIHALRLFKVFTTSSIFEVGHAYTHYGVFKMLECNGDSKTACKKLLDQGFGEKRVFYGDKEERKIFQKKQEGMDQEQLVNYAMSELKKDRPASEEMIKNLSKIWGDRVCTFWDVTPDNEAVINRGRLIDFLYTHGGFALFYYDINSTIYRIVQCRDGLLQEASSEYMKKFIIDYIERLPDTFDGGVTPNDLKNLILKQHDRLFSNGLMEFLPRGQYNLLTDELNAAYFPFKNGVVKVTKEDFTLLSYKDVNKVVWKSQIIDFDIKIDQDIKTKKKDVEYSAFIECISGQEFDKYVYACTLIGYLLHKYKDPAKPYCVILAEENDNENKGGGTGKGIFLSAIGRLANMERVDGKNFKLDKSFAFQRVGLDTKIIAIEDTRKNVDFEGFYSIITEGITVEKKNKDELFIPYKDSPKVVFTTNYAISQVGDHAKRRQKTFEFAPFFGAEKTPVHHFGHNLFDDWDPVEWNLFYNFLFLCCWGYLEGGIQEVHKSVKVKRKEIRLKYGEEFLEWWDEYEKNEGKIWTPVARLHEDFLTSNGIEKKYFSQKRFLTGVGEAATMLVVDGGCTVAKRRVRGQERRVEMILDFGNISKSEIGHDAPGSGLDSF